jgi:hypothetical protein
MLISAPEGMPGAHIGRRHRDTKDEANRPESSGRHGGAPGAIKVANPRFEQLSGRGMGQLRRDYDIVWDAPLGDFASVVSHHCIAIERAARLQHYDQHRALAPA